MYATDAILAFAGLLRYPSGADHAAVGPRVDHLRDIDPDLDECLRPLREFARDNEETALEEVFTRTFDSNAERALEVGWHLHGENYARGAFMVRMRTLLREHGVPENGELPDHVSHVLPVLARADEELARALASGVLGPALTKIEAGFTDDRNPYHGVIAGLRKYLDAGA
jgi:nitrate reductase assembly molybdenum cofactor insertion protein NarJ